jgi:hypothetical protein
MNYLIETNHYEEIVNPALVPEISVDPAGNIINSKMNNTVKNCP